MTEARLATGFWVAAYRARAEAAGLPVYIARRGDDTAGAVLVKCATLDGLASLWAREYDLESGSRQWRRIAQGTEAEIDASARAQAGFDPDLWILEVESRDGRTLLDDEGLT